MQQDGTGRILPQRLFRADYAVTETRRCANFAHDRGTAPQVTPACLIRCHNLGHAQRVEKFVGLREPFTILRNVRATTSPIAP
jgi:hypothetical protein